MQALVTEPGAAHSTRVADVPEPQAGAGECWSACSRSASAAPTARSPRACSASRPRARPSSCSGTSCSVSSSATAHGFSRGDLVTATVRRSCAALPRVRGGLARLVPHRRLQRARHHAPGRVRARARRGGRGAADPCPAPRSAGSACSPSRRRSANARSGTRARSAAASRGSSSARSCSARARSGCSSTLPAPARRRRRVDGGRSSRRSTSSTECGARYVSTQTSRSMRSREDVGGFDLVIEAAGDAQVMADTLGLLRRSGVACLLGIDGRNQTVEHRRAGARRRRDPREPRRSSAASTRSGRTGSPASRRSTARASAGRAHSRPSSGCACRSTASTTRSPTAAARRRSLLDD